MKYSVILLLIICILPFGTVKSQDYDSDLPPCRMGIGLGLGVSTMTGLDGKRHRTNSVPGTDIYYSDGLSSRYSFAGNLNLTLQMNPSSRFVIQPEMNLNVIGTTLRGAHKNDSEQSKLSSIVLPYVDLSLLFGLRTPIGESKYSIILGGGPYFAYDSYEFSDLVVNLAEVYPDEDEWDEWDDEYAMERKSFLGTDIHDSEEIDFRKIDWGFYLMAGVEFSNFQITVRPQFGMANLSKESEYKISNRSFKVNFTVFF